MIASSLFNAWYFERKMTKVHTAANKLSFHLGITTIFR